LARIEAALTQQALEFLLARDWDVVEQLQNRVLP
jgi:hypothetical protein